MTTEEIRAQNYARKGETDRALAIYQRIQPMTPRILTAIAQLSSEKKGDYQHAIKCYTQALQLVDEVIHYTSTKLSFAYTNYFRIVMNVLKS